MDFNFLYSLARIGYTIIILLKLIKRLRSKVKSKSTFFDKYVLSITPLVGPYKSAIENEANGLVDIIEEATIPEAKIALRALENLIYRTQIFIDPQMADDAREYLEERIEEKKELEELKSQDPELVQNAKIAEDFLNQAQETTKK